MYGTCRPYMTYMHISVSRQIFGNCDQHLSQHTRCKARSITCFCAYYTVALAHLRYMLGIELLFSSSQNLLLILEYFSLFINLLFSFCHQFTRFSHKFCHFQRIEMISVPRQILRNCDQHLTAHTLQSSFNYLFLRS